MKISRSLDANATAVTSSAKATGTNLPAAVPAVPPTAGKSSALASPVGSTRDRAQMTPAGSSRTQVAFLEDATDTLQAAGANRSTVAKLSAMSSTQQKQVVELLGVNDIALFTLIDNKKLLSKDRDGQTILSHLQALKTQPVKDGVRPTALISGALEVLADRDKINQGPHGTCGAATLQQAMWKQDPAEMVRIVKNLAQKGESSLRQGNHILKADPNSFGWHSGMQVKNGGKENRNDFNILFQSAVMTSTALVGGSYGSGGVASKAATALTFGALGLAISSTANSQSYNVREDNGGPMAVAKGDSAAHPGKLSGLLRGMTGSTYDIDVRDVTVFGMNWGTFDEMKTQTNAGKEPMAVFHAGDGELHYVTMKSINDKKVAFYDTRGSGGVRTMDLADFKKNFLFNITLD